MREKEPCCCRPLWLTHHSPLTKESKGGQLLPAKRIQVERDTKKSNKETNNFTPSSDDQLAQVTQPIASDIQQGVDLALIYLRAANDFQTFRDAGSFMRVQYDEGSLCQLAKLLRENHEKVPVR